MLPGWSTVSSLKWSWLSENRQSLYSEHAEWWYDQIHQSIWWKFIAAVCRFPLGFWIWHLCSSTAQIPHWAGSCLGPTEQNHAVAIICSLDTNVLSFSIVRTFCGFGFGCVLSFNVSRTVFLTCWKRLNIFPSFPSFITVSWWLIHLLLTN